MNTILKNVALTAEKSRIPSAKIWDAGKISPLRGKGALVIGGTKGIGSGIAVELRKQGCSRVDIVGRDKQAAEAVLDQMAKVDSDSEKSRFYSADLATVKGCQDFVKKTCSVSAPYDVLVFTLGVWPDMNQPLTKDGYRRVSFMDVLARSIVLRGMLREKKLSGNGLVLAVLSSGQKHNSACGKSAETRREVFEASLFKRVVSDAERAQTKESWNVPKTLSTAGVAHDTLLALSSQHFPDLRIVGAFPGLVTTKAGAILIGDGVLLSSLNWLARNVPGGGMQSVEETGIAHVRVINEVLERNGEDAKLSFWSAVHGTQHEIPEMFLDDIGPWFAQKLDEVEASGDNATSGSA